MAPGSDRLKLGLNRTKEDLLSLSIPGDVRILFFVSFLVSFLLFYSVSIGVFYPFRKVSSPYRVLSHLHLLAACVHACMKRMYVLYVCVRYMERPKIIEEQNKKGAGIRGRGFKLKYSHLILIYILPNPGDKASRAAFPGNEEKSA